MKRLFQRKSAFNTTSIAIYKAELERRMEGVGSMGKEREDRSSSLRLGSLNNSSRLWEIGTVSSCLVPGPGMVQGKRNTVFVYES